MSEVYLARQPIFDRKLQVVGYELLFRDAHGNRATDDDDEAATAVISSALTEIGLKRLVGARKAWIRVSPQLLGNGLAELLPQRAVLEIAAEQAADGDFVNVIDDLKRNGNLVAIDHFRYTPEAEPLLRLADVVKLDLVDIGRGQLRRQAARIKRAGLQLLASRVENKLDHAACKQAGCDLFQGYFYCRPEVMQSTRIDASRLAVLDLLAVLQDPRVQLDDLQKRITLDVGLSVRLLRYINSAYFGLRQPVRSIGHAIAMLGLERIRPWAALTLLASVDDKPSELTVTALTRARFCELTAEEHAYQNGSEMFTVGLFSVLDALLDMPISEALTNLPLAPEVRDAIVTHNGPMGQMLECLIALETADFDRAEAILPTAGPLYMSALAWADEAAEPLFAT
ncbi:MAG: EAL and HDOD domain-containing protein [Solirubrobacteraceae bacterium]